MSFSWDRAVRPISHVNQTELFLQVPLRNPLRPNE